MSRRIKMAFALAVLACVVGGVAAMLAPPAEAARCICPQVYAPVTCDHDKTYPNQCVADCHHATNCVPAGIL